MAKKKSKKNGTGQQRLSSENFIKEKIRGLKIGQCYLSSQIQTYGEGYVVVSRLHKGGKVSVAFYLVDIFCVGVKDSSYRLRMEDSEYDQFIEKLGEEGIEECSYTEAHNWIYGAIAFAEEGGIQPDKSFALTQYFLEEDNDDVPLIEYEFGKNGKHSLFAFNNLEASRYLPTLRKNLGNNFDVVIESELYKREEDEADDFDIH